jgi:hypothetical protein
LRWRWKRETTDGLPIGQIELGHALGVVAAGGDAGGFGDVGGGDAQVRGARRIGHHLQLRTQQRGRRGNAAQAFEPAQIALDRRRRGLERARVVAGQHQLHHFARFGADETDPRAG